MIKILKKIFNCLCCCQGEKSRDDSAQRSLEDRSQSSNKITLNLPKTKKEFVLDFRLSPQLLLSKSVTNRHHKKYENISQSFSTPIDYDLHTQDKISDDDIIKLIEISRHESSK